MSTEWYGEPVWEKPIMPLTWKQKWHIRIEKLKFLLGWKDVKHVRPKK